MLDFRIKIKWPIYKKEITEFVQQLVNVFTLTKTGKSNEKIHFFGGKKGKFTRENKQIYEKKRGQSSRRKLANL